MPVNTNANPIHITRNWSFVIFLPRWRLPIMLLVQTQFLIAFNQNYNQDSLESVVLKMGISSNSRGVTIFFSEAHFRHTI